MKEVSTRSFCDFLEVASPRPVIGDVVSRSEDSAGFDVTAFFSECGARNDDADEGAGGK